MKTKTTLKSLALRVHLLVATCIAIMMALAPASRAGLNPPYAVDGNTLHLWHLQDTNGTINGDATNGVYFYDSQSNNTLVVPLLISNTAFGGEYELAGQSGPGAPLVSVYGTNYGYPLAVQNTNDGGFVAPIISISGASYPDLSYAETNNSCSFVNTNTGAFTWEALIQVGFNPTISGGGIGDGSPEILCTDGGNSTPPGANPYTVRAVQFRINCAAPSAGQAQLEFNGNISFSPSTQIHDVKANLPLTGPDAVVQGNWYHVAAAFTGTTTTNGDPADVLTLYWTKFDPSHTNADVLTNFYYFFTITNTSTHTVFTQPYPSNSIVGTGPFVIGNSDRGLNAGWPGNMAEVRISDCYRHTNEFMFNALPATSAPQVTGPATNTLVGYGQNLSLSVQVGGALPEVTLWYQVAGGITNLLLVETNASSLTVSNITYAANNESWFAVVTNLYGSANSAVATVTVGATFNGLFNTGCGPNNNPLDQTAPGSVDLHWMFPPGGNPFNSSPNCIVWSDAGPLSTGGGIVPPNGASVWIGPKANVASAGVTAGTYTFQTTFQVDETAVTPTNWITFTVGACGAPGGETLHAFLNGTETDYTLSGNPQETIYQFNITNGLQAGSNTLAFTAAQNGGDYCALNLGVISDLGVALTTAPSITNQPASTTNIYGSTVSFSAVALGAPPLTYYWLSNGVPITPPVWIGKTLPNLSFVATNFTASQLVGSNYIANVQIVFSNFVGSVTSAVATLDVQVPPLTVASAGVPIWDATTETNIVVTFSQPVTSASAMIAANYSLNNGASVLSAAMGGAPNEVVLTTSALNPANTYTLTVQNVNSQEFGFTMNPSPSLIAVGTYPATVALWVKANTGVTADGSGNVSQWNDLSGNGNTLTDGGYGPPFDPLLTTNAFAYPVIHFVGTNGLNFNQLQTANSTSLAITGDMTVFAVVTFDTLAGNTNGDIVSKTANNNIPAPYDYYANSGNVQFYRGNGTSGANVSSSQVPSVGVSHLLDVVMQGTQVTQRLDGAANGTGTLSATITDAGQGVFIGTRQDGHNRLTGDINELILIGQALSSSDVTSMESYLTTEYSAEFVPAVNANPTNLVFAATNHVLTLSWPADHTGWQLQSQTNNLSVGINTNWVNVAGSTATNQVVIPINLTNGSVFYRLIYTP